MSLREFWERRVGRYREKVYLYFQNQEITYVVLKSNEHLPYHELLEFLIQELAPFKIPQYLVYRPNLPKNTIGRMLKEVLKQESSDLIEKVVDRERERDIGMYRGKASRAPLPYPIIMDHEIFGTIAEIEGKAPIKVVIIP